MKKSHFYDEYCVAFGHEPTVDQSKLIHLLIDFIASQERNQLFLLKGYAGTGKTSILGTLVKVLSTNKFKTRLLAPTGRAAKVLSLKSKKVAFTIHKQIYRRQPTTDGSIHLGLSPNLFKNTIFIVDEASMIGDYSLQKDGKSFKTYTTKDGLAFDIVRSIILDKKGYLWFGTSGGGISKYDGSTFKNYTKKDGLTDDIISCITQDNKGNIWFGTGLGLSRLSPNTMKEGGASLFCAT